MVCVCTALLDLARTGVAAGATGAVATTVVPVVTTVCLVVYVPLVVRLNAIGGDVNLLDVNSLFSGERVRGWLCGVEAAVGVEC